MTNELQPLVSKLESLIANLSAAERRRLTTEVARSLRGSQAKRIRDNKAPDGSAFEQRKPQLQLRKRRGSVRMFAKLQRANWLKPKSNPNEASLTFRGFALRIALIHQLGLRDQVNKNGTQYQYPVRELLGFSIDELKTVEEIITRHLAK